MSAPPARPAPRCNSLSELRSVDLFDATQTVWCSLQQPALEYSGTRVLPTKGVTFYTAWIELTDSRRFVLYLVCDKTLAVHLAAQMFGRDQDCIVDTDARDAVQEFINLVTGAISDMISIPLDTGLPSCHPDYGREPRLQKLICASRATLFEKQIFLALCCYDDLTLDSATGESNMAQPVDGVPL